MGKSGKKTVFGGAEHEGNINLLTKDQQRYLKKGMKKFGGSAEDAINQVLGQSGSRDVRSGYRDFTGKIQEPRKVNRALNDFLRTNESPDAISRQEYEGILSPARQALTDIAQTQDMQGAFKSSVVDPLLLYRLAPLDSN